MRKPFVCAALMLLLGFAASGHAARPLRVLVFAEGYRYGRAGFELAELLNAQPDSAIAADFANTENVLEPEPLGRYEVLVLFNHNDIAEARELNISRFVAGGGGLVALHHVVSRANRNPELCRLIGGWYEAAEGAVEHADFRVSRIPGVEHPVFAGVPESFAVKNDQDFRLHHFASQPVQRLLTCDVQGNGEQEDCGWTRGEGLGRVIYLSPGDPVAERPFLVNWPLGRLILNSVRWAGGAL